ncbi:Glycoside hydrolase family 79 protein [Klebsormidium nitens]|uniref:Glycoside hydrolase family 79 protein n=1 Tax=Klebsormidium nitens TaxID=105231 RepID=A0A1Y1I569_KLENI|nr:Glycoside hydrolase family 79 protein [Klebsormidium nitens]|eukprot:GAQ84311.1 Glycoside hydrolase family 79 protein [Klebsormidium nitens]
MGPAPATAALLLLAILATLSFQNVAAFNQARATTSESLHDVTPEDCVQGATSPLWSLQKYLWGSKCGSKLKPTLGSGSLNPEKSNKEIHHRAGAKSKLETHASNVTLMAPTSVGSKVVNANLVLDTERPVSVTADEFVCVTMDWWSQEKCDYGVCSWGNTSVLSQNLSSPLLRNALTALHPVFRIGGSLQDHIVYNTSADVKCRPMVHNASEIFRFSGGCLNLDRWDELYALANSSGAQLVFGLNGLYGRNRTGWYTYEGDWDPSNARAFLEYSIRKGYDLMGVELGNEIGGPNGIAAKLSPAQYAHDLRTLRTLVDDLYASDSPSQLACLSNTGRVGPLCVRKPLIVAPDNIEVDSAWFREFVRDLRNGTLTNGTPGSGTSVDGTRANGTLGSGGLVTRTLANGTVVSATLENETRVLDGISHHLYSMGAGVEPRVDARMLDPAYHDSLREMFVRARAVKEAAPPGTQLWMGEAGGAFNSGRPGASDAFMSGFWFLHELGSTARYGYDVYCRQTLIGGNYGLLHKDARTPAPDLWAAILFKRLVGPRVLAANVSACDMRAFAHCLKNDVRGDVALVLINYSNDTTYQLSHSLGNARNASDVLVEAPGDVSREEYHFTPGDGGKLHSKASVLNGVELRPFDNGTLPEMLPRVVRDHQEALRLAPWSYAIVVMRGVNVTACHV